MIEVWKPVPGWETSYEVSNLGGVRSIDRMVPNGHGGHAPIKGKVLAQRTQMHGYRVVSLRRGKTVYECFRVHRLVAAAFIPNPEGKPAVNHIDCDRQNNAVTNLEWCTHKENMAHMTALGRRVNYWTGKRTPGARLSREQASHLRSRWKAGGVSLSALASEAGVSKKTILNCVKGVTYSRFGGGHDKA